MTDYLLIPDMAATVEIDPELCRIQMFAPDELDQYKASDCAKPKITIGYIPASRLTAISAMTARDEPDQEKQLLAMAEQQRELVRYGVRGWNLRGEFSANDGRCDESVLDIIERRHWLVPIAVEVSRYNALSEEKKSQ